MQVLQLLSPDDLGMESGIFLLSPTHIQRVTNPQRLLVTQNNNHSNLKMQPIKHKQLLRHDVRIHDVHSQPDTLILCTDKKQKRLKKEIK